MTAQESRSLMGCPFCGGEAVASEINPKAAPGWFHLTVTHNACFYKPSQEVLLLSEVELERWNRRAQPVARTPLSEEAEQAAMYCWLRDHYHGFAHYRTDLAKSAGMFERDIRKQMGITQEKQG